MDDFGRGSKIICILYKIQNPDTRSAGNLSRVDRVYSSSGKDPACCSGSRATTTPFFACFWVSQRPSLGSWDIAAVNTICILSVSANGVDLGGSERIWIALMNPSMGRVRSCENDRRDGSRDHIRICPSHDPASQHRFIPTRFLREYFGEKWEKVGRRVNTYQ